MHKMTDSYNVLVSMVYWNTDYLTCGDVTIKAMLIGRVRVADKRFADRATDTAGG